MNVAFVHSLIHLTIHVTSSVSTTTGLYLTGGSGWFDPPVKIWQIQPCTTRHYSIVRVSGRLINGELSAYTVVTITRSRSVEHETSDHEAATTEWLTVPSLNLSSTLIMRLSTCLAVHSGHRRPPVLLGRCYSGRPCVNSHARLIKGHLAITANDLWSARNCSVPATICMAGPYCSSL